MSKSSKKPAEHPVPVPAGHPDDEVVHVPKGASPLRFLVTVGLMLFVLVIFTVGDQLVGSVRKRGSDAPYMVWVHPSQGEQRYGWQEFAKAKRGLDNFFYVLTGRGMVNEGADEFTAYQLIMSSLALEAGVEVPDAELARVMREGMPGLMQPFLNLQDYRNSLARYDLTPQEFEASLREFLRVDRYETMIAASLGQPEPADIEETWKQSHQQFAFDLVRLSAEDVRAEAEAELPDDEALRAWFEGLEAADLSRLFGEHYTPVRSAAAVLSWPIGADAPAGLLEAFPRPPDADLEQLASSYYNRFRATRFARPAEEPAEGGEGDEQPTPAPLPEPYPFEEVSEQARAEAPIHAALVELVSSLNAQLAAGEELDLAAVAEQHGLQLDADGEARTREEWVERGGQNLASSVASTQPPRFSPFALVDSERMAVVRVTERQPSAPPAFDDVVEPARQAWIDERADALVAEKLEALRTALADAAQAEAPEEPSEEATEPPQDEVAEQDDGRTEAEIAVDAETFARLAGEAGLELAHQDWFDPARRAPDLDALPAPERFLRTSYFPGAELFTLEDGGVLGPLRSFQDESSWLVRVDGRRDPPELAIRPGEYASMARQAQLVQREEVRAELRDPERMAREYGLAFPARSVDEEGDGGGEEG